MHYERVICDVFQQQFSIPHKSIWQEKQRSIFMQHSSGRFGVMFAYSNVTQPSALSTVFCLASWSIISQGISSYLCNIPLSLHYGLSVGSCQGKTPSVTSKTLTFDGSKHYRIWHFLNLMIK